jgi:hypothetical protein
MYRAYIYLAQSPAKRHQHRPKIVVRERCNVTERQNLLSTLSEKISLEFYPEMKHKLGTEEYIEFCSKNERNGLVWMKAGVRKLRGIRKGLEKGTCPLCRGNEDVKHIGETGFCWLRG